MIYSAELFVVTGIRAPECVKTVGKFRNSPTQSYFDPLINPKIYLTGTLLLPNLRATNGNDYPQLQNLLHS